MKNGSKKNNLAEIWNKMKSAFQNFLITQDQTQLHEFRIEVKKISAILNLIDSTCEQPGPLKDFKFVKKIFRHAGKIRDAYLHLNIARNNKLKIEKFEEEQQNTILLETNSFISFGDSYLKKINKAEKRIIKKVKKISIRKVKAFNKHKIEKINLTFSQPVFDEGMHDARKLIKIILYSQLLFSKKKRKKLHLNEPYLHHMQDLIGEWHDITVIAELLNKEQINKERLITTINSKVKSLEENIMAASRHFKKKAINTEKAIIAEV